MASGLRLEKVTPDNVRAACQLELRPGQEGLVAQADDLFHSYLWRLNISGARQGRGYGRFAIDGVCAEARRRGQRRVTVSWHDEPHGPEGFYLRLGFRRTGALNHGEIVGELLLDPPPAG